MAEGGLWRRRPVSLAARLATDVPARLLLEAVPAPLALLDAEGRLLGTNQALRQLAGPVTPPRLQEPATQLFAPEGRAAAAAAIAAADGGAITVRPADPAAPADATWSLSCRPLRQEDGSAGGLLLHLQDITEARRQEARLASAARLETVGRLAGGIAHDFNNLLTAVLGSVAVARDADANEAVQAELVQVEQAVARGAALVKQILAFARQQRLEPRVLALNEAVAAMAPLLQRLLGGRVKLDLALEEPGRLVRVDPAQLDQVILNLSVNARDAMADGGTLRIATGRALFLRPSGEGKAAIPPGRYAVLEVSDTGKGIPAADLPRLFEPFFTTKIDKGGTGLGLATVQGIVAQSGGHLVVESEVGVGTTFRIYLPRHDGPEKPAAAAPAPLPVPPPPVEPDAASDQLVLLVDDEAPLLRLAETVLRRAGYAVQGAACAEDALDLVEAGLRPALLATDVAMPGMDGVELAEELSQRLPGMKVLLLSGYAASTLDPDSAAPGRRFLAKPYSPKDLQAAVAAALEA